jgi:hypothetical protein
MKEEIEMAVRCYPEPMAKGPSKGKYDMEILEDIPSRTIVFDTETTIDRYQNLTFGSFRSYNRKKLDRQGIFYGECLSEKDISILKEYAMSHNLLSRGQECSGL